MPAPMPSPPPVTTATRPSRSRFQSVDAWDALVTRHSDGPYAAWERIAFKMTDSEDSSTLPGGATSCGSSLSWRSCSGCSISWPSPASSMSRPCGARSRRPVPVAPLTYVLVSAVLGAVFVPGPILAATQRPAVRTGPRPVRDAGRDGRDGDHRRASIGKRAGRDSARALLGAERADRLDRLIEPPRTVGGRRPTVHSRRLGCAGLLRIWSVRGPAVADGRRLVHRIGPSGVRLHVAGRVDRRPVVAAGLCGHRDLVHDRDHRRVRHASWLPALASP